MDEIMTQIAGPDWREFINSNEHSTTPIKITKAMHGFASKVGGKAPIARLPVIARGPALRCFMNCRDYVKQHGGEVVYGWAIWQGENYAEAVFHSVVQSKNGKRFCVTKQVDGETEIVFAEDRRGREVAYTKSGEHYLMKTFWNVAIKTGSIFEKEITVAREDFAEIKMFRVSDAGAT